MKRGYFLFKVFLVFSDCIRFGEMDVNESFLDIYLLSCDHDKTMELNTNGVKIHFYDFENNIHTENYIDKALQGIQSHYLNYTKNLVFFIPGYKSNINSPSVASIRKEFQKVPDTYLLIIDYSAYTTFAKPVPVKAYKLSVEYAFYIGRSVGLLVSGLHDVGFSSVRIRGIGFSFGGQILGYAGDAYFKRTSEMLGRLSAVEPAGFCFSSAPLEDQIRSGIAEYVEVYHCNAGFYGTSSVLADVDFYFGNGRIQPKCDETNGVKGIAKQSCSHLSCIRYFAWSITGPGFVAKACRSYVDLVDGSCDGNTTLAGYKSSGDSFGIFHIPEEMYAMI